MAECLFEKVFDGLKLSANVKTVLKNTLVDNLSISTKGRKMIVDLSSDIFIDEKVEKACENVNKDIKVAVMGCAVNGPGEAREADIGVAGGKGYGLIFKKGEILRKLPESELLEALIEEINKL